MKAAVNCAEALRYFTVPRKALGAKLRSYESHSGGILRFAVVGTGQVAGEYLKAIAKIPDGVSP
jgi:hypothetical protein